MIPVIDAFQAIAIFLLGASVGSFLNVCIARLPAGMSVVSPRSRCPRCERQIAWYDNIPIASWLALRGRCRGCALPISLIYPVVEMAIGLAWVATAFTFGVSLVALEVAILVTVLFGIAVIDARHYVIPDGLTVFAFAVTVLLSFAWTFVGDGGPFVGFMDAIYGACVGAGAIAIAAWLGEVAFKKEAMGFGDVTLMAVVGSAVGPGRALLTVFLGACLGALVFLVVVLPVTWQRARSRGEELVLPLVPFGVFLAPAAVLTLLWGDALIAWYRDRVLLG